MGEGGELVFSGHQAALSHRALACGHNTLARHIQVLGKGLLPNGTLGGAARQAVIRAPGQLCPLLTGPPTLQPWWCSC